MIVSRRLFNMVFGNSAQALQHASVERLAAVVLAVLLRVLLVSAATLEHSTKYSDFQSTF